MGKADVDRFGLSTPGVRATFREDGSILLDSLERLEAYPASAAESALAWAVRDPDRLALADRQGGAGDWRRLSYGAFADQTARVAQALLDAGLGPDRPLMLISDNRIEAAVLTFAAYRAGVAVAPITPAYSAGRGDPVRLATILSTLKPGLIVADRLSVHGAAVAAQAGPGVPVLGVEEGGFEDLLRGAPGAALAAAEATVGGDTVAKVMFTSGSTGTPKGVITTHRMLASNVKTITQYWPFLLDEAPILVDWLPWNHCFGGNFVLGTMLSTGGSLHIDDGRPAPGGVERSVANAAEVRPSLHINVPRGLDLTARILADDPAAAEAFFQRLRVVFYASSGLPERIRRHWLELIGRYGQRPVAFCSGWGATETAPSATALNFDAPEINNIGTPVPGCTIKLAPVAGRLELRARGPNVTPGYLNRPDLTVNAFDEEGFWKTGDAGRMADPDRPEAGLLIEGRLAEDFKLASGIWVNVGGLRGQLLETLGPTAREVVISGPGRDDLGLLIFLDVEYCQRTFALAQHDTAALAAHEHVHAHVRDALSRHNEANAGNSRSIVRYRILPRPLDAAGGEVTEKGTVNQALVLQREAAVCEAMHLDQSV